MDIYWPWEPAEMKVRLPGWGCVRNCCASRYWGPKKRNQPSFQAVGRRLSTAEVLGSTWAPLDQLQSTFDEVLVRLGCWKTDANEDGETQQIATQQKTWENGNVQPSKLVPNKKHGGYMEGEQRKTWTPTRPWRFPGHIQRLHRKAEEERQQRHSLVDQWPDMILKGYIYIRYMLFSYVFVWSVVIVGIWGGGVGWMMNGFLSQKMLVSFDHIWDRCLWWSLSPADIVARLREKMWKVWIL